MKFNNESIKSIKKSTFNQNLKFIFKLNLIIFILIISFYLTIGLTYSIDFKSLIRQFILIDKIKVNNSLIDNDLLENGYLLDNNYKLNDQLRINSLFKIDDHIDKSDNQIDKSDNHIERLKIYNLENQLNITKFNQNSLFLNLINQTYSNNEISINRSKRSLNSLNSLIRPTRKRIRKRKSNLVAKRKIKRIVFRIDNWPFIKLFTTRKQLRKRFIRRNARSNSRLFINRNKNKWHRPEKTYTDNDIVKLSSLNNEIDRFDLTLSNILKVRVPGTSGHQEVNEFIINSMRELEWSVEEDVFNDHTPIGELTFRNIIATHNPKSCKRLVFACHYDSKYFKNGKFLGATDSAVPCAMLIEMARNLKDKLDNGKNIDISLQFIFFDGEEAFKKWTDTDSIYGARHLASKWNRQRFPNKDQDKDVCPNKKIVSELDRIELLVLLDLLGTEMPNFYSFFPQTTAIFRRLLLIENKLNKLQLLDSKNSNYFQKRQMIGNMISDDHVPFMKLDVDILHIIPYPFPKVWHKLTDNENALHRPTINNLMRIFQLFISSYLHL